MDVEKTMQFLLGQRPVHVDRLANLEAQVTRLATIAEMQIVSHDRLAERTAAGFAKVDEQLRQLAEAQKATDAQLKATGAQLRATDDRLNALIQIVDGVIRRPAQ